MDKLADGLQKLGEDDLLQVVQMVHDNKAPDSYTRNDVERASPDPALPLQDTNLYRGRIPRRPVHAPRQSDQNALGLHPGEGGAVMPSSVCIHLRITGYKETNKATMVLDPWRVICSLGLRWFDRIEPSGMPVD